MQCLGVMQHFAVIAEEEAQDSDPASEPDRTTSDPVLAVCVNVQRPSPQTTESEYPLAAFHALMSGVHAQRA